MSQTHSENRKINRVANPTKQLVQVKSDQSYQVKLQGDGQFNLIEASPMSETSEKTLFDYFGSMKGYWGDPESFIKEIRSDRDSGDR